MEENDAGDSSSDEELELHPIQNLPVFERFSFIYRDPHLFGGILKPIISRDLDKLKQLIEGGCNVRSIDNLGNTILHVAAACCTEENTKILEYLLSLDDVEIDAVNFQGQTSLLLCTLERLETPAGILIDAGADITKASLEGVTPLHCTVRFSERLTRKFIVGGADMNCPDYSEDTPLHDAVTFGELEVVCMLLYYGADTSVRNSAGMTPFMLSLATAKVPMALELFDYVTDFDLTTEENMSTLFLAILCRFPRIIDMCVRGADVNWNGNTKYNVFNLGIFPKLGDFRYLWSRFDCENWRDNTTNILTYCLRDADLKYGEKLEIVLEIFKDWKKATLLINHSSEELTICYLVHRLYKMGVSQRAVHNLVACMLVCNTVVGELDLDTVYEYYGYCETFKLLLYMDIKPNTYPELKLNTFPALIYRTSWLGMFGWEDRNSEYVDYENLFDHLIEPTFKRDVLAAHSSSNIDADSSKLIRYVSATPDVPLLQDLARIKSRDFIREHYKAATSCKFYTVLQRLALPRIIEQLIAFEIPLYRQFFTGENLGFRELLKRKRQSGHSIVFNNMTKIVRNVKEELIKSAFEPSQVVVCEEFVIWLCINGVIYDLWNSQWRT